MTSGASDPVVAGLVESLARPGGNVTGITLLNRELGGKRLELLKEVVTKISRVAALYEPALPSNIHEVKERLPTAAQALGLTVQPWDIGAADHLETVFAALSKERFNGLYVISNPVANAQQKRLAGLALKNRLPSVYVSGACRGRWAHVLRRGPRGQLPARRHLRGQNFKGRQAR
jgi:putative ABC transport system substrate-binding protein